MTVEMFTFFSKLTCFARPAVNCRWASWDWGQASLGVGDWLDAKCRVFTVQFCRLCREAFHTA